MSLATIGRLTRATRHICARCGKRRARFQYRGVVRADRDHTLCFRCFRSETDRQRARILGGLIPASLITIRTLTAVRQAV